MSAARPEEHKVVFRFRPGGKVFFAELRGELVHWYHPHPLTGRPDREGDWETTLPAGVGTYAYKFRTSDGEWHLDAHNPRTRACDGARNSLLVVGGAEEPVLHAPARPYLFLEDDGRLCVRAGLRRGTGPQGEAALTLRYYEDGAHEVPMRLCGAEDEHLLFEAHVPVSQRRFEYLFVLPDGRCVGAPGGGAQAFSVPLRELRSHTPAWWRDAVVYTVFVDRFRQRGGTWDGDGAEEQARRGGDLFGVIEALPHLAELGVTVLHLTPIGLSPSSHRYDAVDPRVVDPALGGEAALAELLARAHERGLRVLLDLPVTHVHRDFFAFRDVRERGKASSYWDWFHCKRHPFGEGHDPGYEHYQKGQWQEPLLRLDHEEVVEYLAETCARYARLGADGFRVDAAAEVPLPLLRRLRQATRAVRPDAVLFGEIIPDNLHRFTFDSLDAATDFPGQQALYDWLWRRRGDAARAAAIWRRRRFSRGGPAWSAISFSATHDQHRFLSLVKDPRVARLAHLLVLLRPEVPALCYGDEVGLHTNEPPRNFEDVWPDRQPMPWDPRAWDPETLSLFRDALRLRREHPALHRGDEEFLPIQPATATPENSDFVDVLWLRRRHGEQVMDIVVNGGPRPAAVLLPTGDGAPSLARLLLPLGEADLDLRARTLSLGAHSAAVLLREPDPGAVALWSEAIDDNRRLCALSFQEGLVESLTLPTHLYLTVTEACNLRCRHCITLAPDKTQGGTARQAQPWLLDALQPAFAAADYFAFAHGGESLVAPIFPEVLRSIRSARAGRPYHVHLLSNGMLLDEPRVRQLIDLGVTSLAVSIDGASAATNDAIRTGARLDRILQNLRGALRLRREMGADVRIGISTVIAASNVDEMESLGRLSKGLGVDWIKVEEMYPTTAFARREMILPRSERVRRGLEALRRLVEPGIVVVDHLSPPQGCPCQAGPDSDNAKANPALRAFREADDFANRARFHPCRMPWEQACVDPDGTVHPVDYYHPPLGSLLQTPFLDLWQGESMRRLRAEALSRFPAALRIACPHI